MAITIPQPEEMMKVDAAYWASLRQIRLQAGIFSLRGREYQIQPMQSTSRRLCCRKATQGGWTELVVLRSLHGLIYGFYPKGILYLFPTSDNVQDFSKSRFNPLIENNPTSIGKYVKKTDSAELKKVGNAFLYFRGARLGSMSGGAVRESVSLRSLPADCVVFEEFDLMDETVTEKAKGRMGDSSIKQEIYLSNPTLPGIGIDAQFEQSDQQYWHRQCSCGHYTSADLEFPNCVKLRSNGTGYIACAKCGKELPLFPGKYIAMMPSNSSYMEGYHWSQLDSMHNDPAEILADYNEPPNDNLADVKRNRLGMPHVDAEDKLTEAQVRACCGMEAMTNRHDGPCAMGVDMGKGKHVVIGMRTAKDRYEVVRVAQVGSLNDVHDLARAYNVRCGVIDIRPYEDEVRQFQKQERFQIYLSQYRDNWHNEPEYDGEAGIVHNDRTQMCDKTHRLFTEKMITIPRRCQQVDTFVAQVCNIAKVLETNAKTGVPTYRYRYCGSRTIGDHYRHALNYFILAAQRVAVGNRSGHKVQTKAITEYDLLKV